MIKEIKPCPFCGGDSVVGTVRYDEGTVKYQGWKQSQFYYVSCVVCQSRNQGLVGHRSEEAAIEKWNIRQPPLGLIGTCVECGDDQSGQSRLTIHTTREQIQSQQQNPLFKSVTITFHEIP